MIFEQGDIVSINLDPPKRHEPAGRHYAVVVSPWEVNSHSSLTAVLPITSTDNGYPLHVPIAAGNCVGGFVQCEAVRAMDPGAREAEGALRHEGSLDDHTLSLVLAYLKVALGLD